MLNILHFSWNQLFRRILWCLPLFVFPILIFYPVFTNLLGNVLLVPNVAGLTDTLGLVRIAQMAPTLSSPFGIEYWTNFPSGEQNWSLSGLTQGLQIIIFWVLGNLFNSFVAANLFLYSGWVFTGAAVMYLTKNLGTSNFVALTAGVTSQFLQSMQLANATVPSMVFVGFPILVIAFLLKWSVTSSSRYFYLGSSVLLFSAIFDGYIYYFSLVAFWVMLILRPKRHFAFLKQLWQLKVALILVGSSLPFLAKIANMLGADSSGTNRQLVSPSVGLMNANGFTFSQYLSPHPESFWVTSGIVNWVNSTSPRLAASFVGIGIGIFVFWGIFKAIKLRKFPILGLSIATLVFYLFSLHGIFSIFGVVIPNPAALTLWFFPGALYIDRSAFVVQALFVCLAFAGLWLVFANSKISRFTNLFAAGLLILSFVELQPFASRVVINEYEDYRTIRNEISGDPFVFLPDTYKGRSWIQQVYVESPMMNSLQNPKFAELVLDKKFPKAPSEIACELKSMGINNVVLEKRYWKKDPEVRNKLVAPYFTQTAVANVSAYEDGKTEMVVLKVKADCLSG